MVVLKQLNEGVIKRKNPGKCRQRTKLFDSGRNLWELINTQTKTQNETRFRIVSLCKSETKKNCLNN
jgi:hypothetical protein